MVVVAPGWAMMGVGVKMGAEIGMGVEMGPAERSGL